MSKSPNRNSLLTGVAGEYYVAAELSAMGYIASVTLRNTRGVDIVASSLDASRSVAIQVKTNRGNRRAWVMHKKSEGFFKKNYFYVFVNLKNRQGKPDYYIVPSKDVSKNIIAGHKKWISTPGRDGRKHKITTMRMFRDKEGRYLDKWEKLGL